MYMYVCERVCLYMRITPQIDTFLFFFVYVVDAIKRKKMRRNDVKF